MQKFYPLGDSAKRTFVKNGHKYMTSQPLLKRCLFRDFLDRFFFHGIKRVVEILPPNYQLAFQQNQPTKTYIQHEPFLLCFSSPPSSWPLIPPSSLVGMSSSSDVLRWPQSFSTALPESLTFVAHAVSAFLQPCSASVP